MADEPYIVFGSPCIGDDEVRAVEETLRSCWIGTGPRVQEFEAEIERYTGARHAVAVGSCTAALHLAMLANRLGPGDEVITTPLTFAATANAILHTGATPIFADVDRETLNLDPEAVEAVIGEKTRAILPVHFAGRPCDMDALERLASASGLVVIEDAAHALGASVHGRRVGSRARSACFSFYVTKNATTGEGGVVCTDSPELANEVKVQALHGLSADAWSRFGDKGHRHYEVVSLGFKYNMTDIQAALGLCQMRKFDEGQKRREEIWARYDEAFAGLPCRIPTRPAPDTEHARHLYTLLIDLEEAPVTRDQFIEKLHERGIGTGVHYRALHLHRYYRERYGFEPSDFPHAAWISERTVSLPLSPKLGEREVERIIGAVGNALGRS